MNTGCIFFSGSVILFGLFLYFKEVLRRRQLQPYDKEKLIDDGFDSLRPFFISLFLIILISFIISLFSDGWYQFTVIFISILLIVLSMYGYSANSSKESISQNPIPMTIVFLVEFIFLMLISSEWVK